MTVTLELEPEVELTAAEQAKVEGLSLDKYVEIVVKEAVNQRERVKQLAQKSFDEILSPSRKGFQESGMSEEELLELFEEAREEVWLEK